MTSTTKIWIHGMAAAAISGLSSAAIAYFAAPQAFNFSNAGLIAFAKVIVLGAALPTFAYLKQSPIPALSATVSSQTDTETPTGTETTKSTVTVTKNS